MKSTIKLFGIIAFVAVIGFSMASCDDADDDALNGTWVSSDGTKLVLNNGKITEMVDDVGFMRGTYTTNGSNITITFTEINGAMVTDENGESLLTAQWYTEAQFRTAMIQALVNSESDPMSQEEAEEFFNERMGSMFGTLTGTFSGNTLTVTMGGQPFTFTRVNTGGNTGGNTGNNNSLNGTWVSSDGTKLVVNNGNITEMVDNVGFMRGTYTTSGSNITITFTEINGAMVTDENGESSLQNQWYTEAQLREAMIPDLVNSESDPMSQEDAEEFFNERMGSMFRALTGRFSGNTLTVTMGDEPTTFTRQN